MNCTFSRSLTYVDNFDWTIQRRSWLEPTTACYLATRIFIEKILNLCLWKWKFSSTLSHFFFSSIWVKGAHFFTKKKKQKVVKKYWRNCKKCLWIYDKKFYTQKRTICRSYAIRCYCKNYFAVVRPRFFNN